MRFDGAAIVVGQALPRREPHRTVLVEQRDGGAFHAQRLLEAAQRAVVNALQRRGGRNLVHELTERNFFGHGRVAPLIISPMNRT